MSPLGSAVAALLLVFVGQSSACYIRIRGRELEGSEFDYSDGALGPANWPSLFETCGGNEQSPIDIPAHAAFVSTAGSNVTEIPTFKLKYSSSIDLTSAEVKLENLNKTVEVVLSGLGVQLKAEGLDKLSQLVGRSTELVDSYILEQFHFHWGLNDNEGSEHTVGTEAFAAEMHLVHFNAKYSSISEAAENSDGILVIASFLEVHFDDEEDDEDEDDDDRRLLDSTKTFNGDKVLGPIVEALSEANFVEDGEIDLHELDFSLDDLSAELDTSKFYLYPGSLTTPTCNQVLTWVVLKNPLKISEETISAFRATKQLKSTSLIAPNFRPTQEGNGRTVFDAEDQKAAFADAAITETSTNAGKIVAGILVPIGAVAIFGSVAAIVTIHKRRELAKKHESEIFDVKPASTDLNL